MKTYTYYSNPHVAVEQAGLPIEGIQAYIIDNGLRSWTCVDPVYKCDRESAINATTWWQEEWDIAGGITFIKTP